MNSSRKSLRQSQARTEANRAHSQNLNSARVAQVLERINRNEIELKITNLVRKLRGRNNERIALAAATFAEKVSARDPKRVKVFGGGHIHTMEEAHWVGRTRAELDFLRDYLRGVIQIYDGYFRRLELKLHSLELETVWSKEVEPLWNGMLLTLEDELKGTYPGNEPSVLQHRMSEFGERTALIFTEAANEWDEKVEEAVSDEQFSQPNAEIAAPVVSGRDPEIIAKAIAARTRKSSYIRMYMRMWNWLEAGNKPAVFIHENPDLLKSWGISNAQAFKMFHRVKSWREKGLMVIQTEPDQSL